MKAFAEVGLTAAVREVLRRAVAPDSSGLRAELEASSSAVGAIDLRNVLASTLKDFAETQLVQVLDDHKKELRAYVDTAIAAARESSVVELTRQRASSSLSKEEVLRCLCRELSGGEEGVTLLKEFGHLPISTYLEQKLPPAQHYVIRHFMPPFASRVQEGRLNLAMTGVGEKPFMAWNNGAWRLVYFEADREAMDTTFDTEEMKATLSRMLTVHMPAVALSDEMRLVLTTQRRQRQASSSFGGRRRGPYAPCCNSVNVNMAAVTSFFGATGGANGAASDGIMSSSSSSSLSSLS